MKNNKTYKLLENLKKLYVQQDKLILQRYNALINGDIQMAVNYGYKLACVEDMIEELEDVLKGENIYE